MGHDQLFKRFFHEFLQDFLELFYPDMERVRPFAFDEYSAEDMPVHFFSVQELVKKYTVIPVARAGNQLLTTWPVEALPATKESVSWKS